MNTCSSGSPGSQARPDYLEQNPNALLFGQGKEEP